MTLFYRLRVYEQYCVPPRRDRGKSRQILLSLAPEMKMGQENLFRWRRNVQRERLHLTDQAIRS